MKKLIAISIVLLLHFSVQANNNKIILQTDTLRTTFNLLSGWREICVLESNCHCELHYNSDHILKCERTFLVWVTALNYLMALVWGITLYIIFDKVKKVFFCVNFFLFLFAIVPPYYFLRLYQTLNFEKVQNNFTVSLLIFLIISALTMLIIKKLKKIL